jgi:hypothetical protein
VTFRGTTDPPARVLIRAFLTTFVSQGAVKEMIFGDIFEEPAPIV